MNKLDKNQSQEISRCAGDFSYFCEKYVNLNLNTKTIAGVKNPSVSPFKLHPYQVRLYEHLENNRFTIFSKFRQGGFTTQLAIYGLWKCLFQLDQYILWISPRDHQACDVCDLIVKIVIENLPDWMCGNVGKMTNSHQKCFLDTNSNIKFCTPESASGGCGRSCTLLIIDDASFISNMDQHWRALYPTIMGGAHTGGAVICSAVTREDHWFWQTRENAILYLNSFSGYRCNYKERPEFCDYQWELEVKKNIGQFNWEIEYEQKPIEIEDKPLDKPSEKLSKGLWRSIYDEWDGSINLDQRSLESE
jgi:hypothetical protein